MSVVVVDTETTGLHAGSAEIIEVAIHQLARGKVVDQWSTLIRPTHAVPEVITDLTRISTEMVAAAPSFVDVADEVAERLRGRLICGQNIPFDLRFLRAAFAIVDRPAPLSTSFGLCTLSAARGTWERDSYSLGSLAEWLGLETAGWHRADADCVMTTGLLNALRAQQSWPTLLRRGLRQAGDRRRRPAVMLRRVNRGRVVSPRQGGGV